MPVFVSNSQGTDRTAPFIGYKDVLAKRGVAIYQVVGFLGMPVQSGGRRQLLTARFELRVNFFYKLLFIAGHASASEVWVFPLSECEVV